MKLTFTCRCTWRGIDCPNEATAEDGLCNWCAPLLSRPVVLDHRFTSPHLGGRPSLLNPGEHWTYGVSCWHVDSGRTIRSFADLSES